MSSRDIILDAVKRNQPQAVPLPDVPQFDSAGEPLLERFKTNVERMGGKLAEFAAGADGIAASLFTPADESGATLNTSTAGILAQ